MKTWILTLSELIRNTESFLNDLTTGMNMYSCQKSGVSLEKELLTGKVSEVDGLTNFVFRNAENNPVIGLVKDEDVYCILGTGFAYPQSQVGAVVSISMRGSAFLSEKRKLPSMMRSVERSVIDRSGSDAILRALPHADRSYPEIWETVPESHTGIVGPDRPIARHSVESMTIGRSIGIPGSAAWEVLSDLGAPRKTIPNNLEKHAIASPPMSASETITTIEQKESCRLAEVTP